MSEQVFDKMHAQRLTDLANALDAPVLPLLVDFDYSVILRETHCGTVGCAIGLAQIMWPGFETLIPSRWGLTSAELCHLFVPERQSPERFGGKMLNRYVTRHEVAAGIRAFLEYKAKQSQEQVGE